MKAKRCTKCKWFRKSRGKVKCDREGNISISAPNVFEGLATYICKNRWWSYDSHRYFAVGDVCEDFEFKSNKQ